MIRFVWLALAALGMVATGCTAAGPLNLTMSYASSEARAMSWPRTLPCHLRIAAVSDDRPGSSTNNLGERGGGAVTGDHLPQWVADGLGTVVEQRDAAADTDVTAGVSIQRLYAHSVATDLEAVVALEVRYARRDGSVFQRDYRGRAQKVYWFAAAGEYQEVLNRALEDVVHQIVRDLPAVCAADVAHR